jgi:hypothetical protein
MRFDARAIKAQGFGASRASARLTFQQHRVAWIPGFSAADDRSSTTLLVEYVIGER